MWLYSALAVQLKTMLPIRLDEYGRSGAPPLIEGVWRRPGSGTAGGLKVEWVESSACEVAFRMTDQRASHSSSRVS